MKKFTLLFCLIINSSLFSQIIKVQPYLQDASPNSIFILWETDASDESIVEWGLTETLGNTTEGTAQTSVGEARIHEVQLENLERFTKYYYRVKTGDAISPIHRFKTPPFADDNEPVRIIAMSDMQRDGSFPNKYSEIIHDGIIDYLTEETGGDLIDNLALVLIPGDLVPNGNDYGSWAETFFTPSEDLFSQVPVYPVPGNHENNSAYFFQYFKLPDNGTPDFEEHWWHKDYGNVRIIGLDSNNPFSNQEQLDWLDGVLDTTCEADSIDFVFAQLHHPHKSELWTPGESDYTGEVINKLEQFTTTCGKPSVHFFGHTHGYSRGQSRDHKHLWINAATAGGAIDNWGEFPNFDYDEFSVSQDEYGFVSVEVTDGDDPKITVKRISRGDQDAVIDNALTDSLTLYKNDGMVNIPVPEFPINVELAPECVVLEANTFSAPNSTALHGQSHWQVSTSQDDFSSLAGESWKNFENWYFEIDTQAEDDLTDEAILGLEENSTYWWRVRYRDREFNWSGWSNPVSFSTTESIALPNLLVNPGAEDSLANWIPTEGVVEALTDGVCAGIAPHSGTRYFAVGGLCEESEIGICVQNVDVTSYADSIDAGNYLVDFGGYLSNFSGTDLPEMRLIFLAQNGAELGVSNTISSLSSSWTNLNEQTLIPASTRTIQMELKGTRFGGADNDSYFDDLFLSVGADESDCDAVSSIINRPFSKTEILNISPNPLSGEGVILLPNAAYSKLRIFVVNATGTKVDCPVQYEGNRIIVDTDSLSSGTYFFLVRENGKVIGKGKMVVV